MSTIIASGLVKATCPTRAEPRRLMLDDCIEVSESLGRDDAFALANRRYWSNGRYEQGRRTATQSPNGCLPAASNIGWRYCSTSRIARKTLPKGRLV